MYCQISSPYCGTSNSTTDTALITRVNKLECTVFSLPRGNEVKSEKDFCLSELYVWKYLLGGNKAILGYDISLIGREKIMRTHIPGHGGTFFDNLQSPRRYRQIAYKRWHLKKKASSSHKFNHVIDVPKRNCSTGWSKKFLLKPLCYQWIKHRIVFRITSLYNKYLEVLPIKWFFYSPLRSEAQWVLIAVPNTM